MKIENRLIVLARHSGIAIYLTVLTGFLLGLCLIFQAYILSIVVSDVIQKQKGLIELKPLLLLLLVVIIIRSILTYGSDIFAGKVAATVKLLIRRELFHKLFKLGPAYVNQERSGELATIAIQGMDALDAYFRHYLPQLILAALIPVSILVVVFPLDGLSFAILLVTLPLIPIFMILIGRGAESVTHKQWAFLRRMSAFLLDIMQGLTSLKRLNQAYRFAKKVEEVSEKYRSITIKVLRLSFLSAFFLEFISTISIALLAVEIGLRLLYGRMGLETAFFVLVIAPDFYLPMRLLGQYFHAGKNGVVAAEQIFGLLDQSTSFEKDNVNISVSYNRSLNEEQFVIDLENVSYRYPDRHYSAVQDVSFRIPSGQHVALVGESSAGKSTLVHLLMKFIKPSSGEIRFNGISLDAISTDVWREQVAFVSQTPYLFNDTIFANILLGRQDATCAEVIDAAEKAHVDEFISGLSHGYDTVIGERGERLSGGQAQRIAIARAFLRNPRILLLDEYTAHLDISQERILQESLERLFMNRTVVMIAHRIATASRANMIFVMSSGRVVESGDHASLLNAKGAYYQLTRGLSESR